MNETGVASVGSVEAEYRYSGLPSSFDPGPSTHIKQGRCVEPSRESCSLLKPWFKFHPLYKSMFPRLDAQRGIGAVV